MVTILDRKTRFYLINKVKIELLMPYKAHVLKVTADNGREFANHEEIANALDTKVYFAHPYRSCERGAK
jgi:IS30 family transposase